MMLLYYWFTFLILNRYMQCLSINKLDVSIYYYEQYFQKTDMVFFVHLFCIVYTCFIYCEKILKSAFSRLDVSLCSIFEENAMVFHSEYAPKYSLWQFGRSTISATLGFFRILYFSHRNKSPNKL